MGIFKLFIKSSFCILLCITIINCKQQKKNNITKSVVVSKTKDIIPKFPSYLTKNYVLGQFDYKKDPSFIKVSTRYSSKEIYIRKKVYNAFLKMLDSAKKEGIDFTIISGTRNFKHQKRIWNYKWNTKYNKLSPLKRIYKILEFSSMPATSRHHWGTDIDINSLNNSYFNKGKGKKEYDWLVKNAHKFGFFQPYTSKENGRTGYFMEKWHWSYKPLSKVYLKYYNEYVNYDDIKGFEGSKYASKIAIIKNYVNGINPKFNN